jgi:hypothetical protein
MACQMLMWAAAESPASLPIAHQHPTLAAARAEADRAMASGLLGPAGLDLYASLDGVHWHVAEHRDPPALTGLAADLAGLLDDDEPTLPALPAAAPPVVPPPPARRRFLRDVLRQLRGERDLPHGPGGCRMAALLLLLCMPVGLLLAGYCGWVLASSPAAACSLALWPRRGLGGWNCPCGTYNSGFGPCRGCGRSRG